MALLANVTMVLRGSKQSLDWARLCDFYRVLRPSYRLSGLQQPMDQLVMRLRPRPVRVMLTSVPSLRFPLRQSLYPALLGP